MRQCKEFDYKRRCGDSIGGLSVAWTMELSGPEGAVYHFWFPRCSGEELEYLKKESKRAAYHMGDPTGFTFDWIPV